MPHTDKAGEQAVPPGQVDLDHVLDDIHYDRRTFNKQSNVDSARKSQQMEQTGLLPDFTIG